MYRGALIVPNQTLEVVNTLVVSQPTTWTWLTFVNTHHNTEDAYAEVDKKFTVSADRQSFIMKGSGYAKFRANGIFRPRSGYGGVGEVQLCITLNKSLGSFSCNRPSNQKVISGTTTDFGCDTYVFPYVDGQQFDIAACYYGASGGPPIDLIGCGFQVEIID